MILLRTVQSLVGDEQNITSYTDSRSQATQLGEKHADCVPGNMLVAAIQDCVRYVRFSRSSLHCKEAVI